MAELNFLHHIDISEIIQLLNKGVLSKVRWQLGTEKSESELTRILNGTYLENIRIQGVYGYFSSLEIEKLSAQIPESQNIFPLFAVTTGDSGKTKLSQLYKEGSFFDYFLLNGLLSELAEATAQHIENIVKKENNMQKSGRISPGYPLWKDISDQSTILKYLETCKIGISLTTAFQLIPEHSITGMVISR